MIYLCHIIIKLLISFIDTKQLKNSIFLFKKCMQIFINIIRGNFYDYSYHLLNK